MSRPSGKGEMEAKNQRYDDDHEEDSSNSNSDDESMDEKLGRTPSIEAFGYHYHASGKIFLPYDKDERRRIELQHKLYRVCLDGALTSTRLPLDTAKIVDLGTGTGVWAVEMAARYPQAHITGVDVYPIQRRKGVPPNVAFEIDDIENPWKFPDDSIDFIHMRSVAGGVRDWVALFLQAYHKLKPGGLLEMSEVALSIYDFDGKFAEAELRPDFMDVFYQFSKQVNMDFSPVADVPDWLVEAGFEKIVQHSEILPVGYWAQDDKLKARQTLMNAITSDQYVLHGLCSLLFQTGGYTKEEYEAIVPSFRQTLTQPGIRPYIRAVFTTARKPRATEDA